MQNQTTQRWTRRMPTANTGLAKVAVQCSADTFVVNQILVLRINICAENRQLSLTGHTATVKASGQTNNKSDDAVYMKLVGNLRDNLKLLAKEIEPKVYEYGFLKG